MKFWDVMFIVGVMIGMGGMLLMGLLPSVTGKLVGFVGALGGIAIMLMANWQSAEIKLKSKFTWRS